MKISGWRARVAREVSDMEDSNGNCFLVSRLNSQFLTTNYTWASLTQFPTSHSVKSDDKISPTLSSRFWRDFVARLIHNPLDRKRLFRFSTFCCSHPDWLPFSSPYRCCCFHPTHTSTYSQCCWRAWKFYLDICISFATLSQTKNKAKPIQASMWKHSTLIWCVWLLNYSI